MSENSARRSALTLTLPLCLAYAVGALCDWGSLELARIMGDFGLAAAAGAAAVSCSLRAVRCAGRDRLAWFLFAASATTITLGNSVWGWYEVVLDRPVPTPGPADWCFLFFAPPAIAGLLLVAQRPRGVAAWLCMCLDGWLVAGSLFTLGWTLALARTADGDPGDAFRVGLTLAYPVMDILLVSMVLGLRFRAGRGDRAALNLAVIALALTVVCDAVFTTPGVHGHYRSGEILDTGWFAGSVLLAAAPWAGRREPRRSLGGPRTLSMLSALTPYVAAAVCTGGVVAGTVGGRPPDAVSLVAGGSVLVALVLRQGVTLVDNVFMAQELAAKESHFRSLVQGSSDVIMIASHDGLLSYVSHAVRRVYGFEPEELVGTRLDLLIHPEDLSRVRGELASFLTGTAPEEMTRIECRVRCAGGTWLHTESAVNRYGDGIILNSRDVTDRVRLQAQLEHDAFHDRLTGLPNRALFEDRIQHALSQRRGTAPTVAVLFLDLDGFKAVNDHNGHAVGDELLCQAARRLEHSVRAGDTVARFGGDEFAALLVGEVSPLAIREIAERLLVALSAPYRVGTPEGVQVRVAASIGIAFSAPGIDPAALMRHADLAMYQAKAGGKGRAEVYSPAMLADDTRRVEQAAGRRRGALHEHRVEVLYQPVVDLADGRVRAAWVMVRNLDDSGPATSLARHLLPDGQAPSPQPSPAGRWILEDAVAQAAAWRGAGLELDLVLGVDASQVAGAGVPYLAEAVDSALRHGGLPPSALTLLITGAGEPAAAGESGRGAVLRTPDAASAAVGPLPLADGVTLLRSLGVRLAVAGVGTGRMGLPSVRRLPLDGVVIDRSVTAEVGTCAQVTAVASTVARLGLDLGLTVTAAGVENRAQAAALREMGCRFGQGPLYSGPLDGAALARFARCASTTARREGAGPAPVPGQAAGSPPPSGQQSPAPSSTPPARSARSVR